MYILIGMKLVRVSWYDVVEHETGWHEFSELEQLDYCLVHSYGLLAHETPEKVTLIADIIPETKEFGRSTTIPKGMIKDIKYIPLED